MATPPTHTHTQSEACRLIIRVYWSFSSVSSSTLINLPLSSKQIAPLPLSRPSSLPPPYILPSLPLISPPPFFRNGPFIPFLPLLILSTFVSFTPPFLRPLSTIFPCHLSITPPFCAATSISPHSLLPPVVHPSIPSCASFSPSTPQSIHLFE